MLHVGSPSYYIPVCIQRCCTMIIFSICQHYFCYLRFSPINMALVGLLDVKYKVLFIGDSCVGKTSFISRYCDGQFTNTFIATVGIDLKIKRIERQLLCHSYTCTYSRHQWDMSRCHD